MRGRIAEWPRRSCGAVDVRLNSPAAPEWRRCEDARLHLIHKPVRVRSVKGKAGRGRGGNRHFFVIGKKGSFLVTAFKVLKGVSTFS